VRYLNVVVSALFFWIAFIQLNDPDPIYWVAVYSAVAVIAGLRVFNRDNLRLRCVTAGMIAAGLAISVGGFVSYLSSGDYGSIMNQMSVSQPQIEYAREFVGLAIATITIAGYSLMARRESTDF